MHVYTGAENGAASVLDKVIAFAEIEMDISGRAQGKE